MKALPLLLAAIAVSLVSFAAGRFSAPSDGQSIAVAAQQEWREAHAIQSEGFVRIGATNLRLLRASDYPEAIKFNCKIATMGLRSIRDLPQPSAARKADVSRLINGSEATVSGACSRPDHAPNNSFKAKPLRGSA